jgi:hypothetical protein
VVRPGADVSFTFTQKFKLALDASTQQVTLQADGDPSVNTNLPFNFLHEAFENAIKTARDDALSAGVNDAVKGIFDADAFAITCACAFGRHSISPTSRSRSAPPASSSASFPRWWVEVPERPRPHDAAGS